MAVISAGTTLIDAGAISVPTGALTLIKSITASSSASISFVDGASGVVLDDTYKSYVFKFINIHAATSGAEYQFNLSIDSGSNYNVAKTSTAFESYHMEDDSGSGLVYQGNADLAQGTGDQQLFRNLSTDNDCSYSGSLKLFNPSSDTFVKHYIARGNGFNTTPLSDDFNVAGYGNTTSAVDAIQFKMSSGNIDSGIIKMYGVT
tara:strand:- start:607 stop:1218 length:612 start_codon:yes stop_codon:yes gene_type:complete